LFAALIVFRLIRYALHLEQGGQILIASLQPFSCIAGGAACAAYQDKVCRLAQSAHASIISCAVAVLLAGILVLDCLAFPLQSAGLRAEIAG
jgi:hypothetical protein